MRVSLLVVGLAALLLILIVAAVRATTKTSIVPATYDDDNSNIDFNVNEGNFYVTKSVDGDFSEGVLPDKTKAFMWDDELPVALTKFTNNPQVHPISSPKKAWLPWKDDELALVSDV